MKFKHYVPFLLTFVIVMNSVTLALADDSTTYSYDANGNLISDGVQCYTYNDANQMAAVRACATNQLIAEYVYDHTGQRIVEKHYQNGALQETVYTIGKHTETTVPAGGARQDTTYYRSNNEIIARKNPDTSKNFYHQDHLGSTGALTNAGGQLVEETRYYPFGAVRAGGALSRFLYTGQESDAETGLYYYGARFYDPALARFAQPDSMLPSPYDPQQLNRYSYVTNNPLNYIDPSGHSLVSKVRTLVLDGLANPRLKLMLFKVGFEAQELGLQMASDPNSLQDLSEISESSSSRELLENTKNLGKDIILGSVYIRVLGVPIGDIMEFIHEKFPIPGYRVEDLDWNPDEYGGCTPKTCTNADVLRNQTDRQLLNPKFWYEEVFKFNWELMKAFLNGFKDSGEAERWRDRIDIPEDDS